MARELERGHVLVLRSGPVVVLRVTPSHKGIDLLVRPVAGRNGKGTGSQERLLWFWGVEAVSVEPEKVALDVPISPGRAEAARAGWERRVRP